MNYKMIQSIENTKILKISLIVFLAFFGGVLAFIFRKWEGVLSFELAFLSFACVFVSLSISMSERLKNIQPLEAEDEPKTSFQEKMSMGLGLMFSFFRIFAYVLLVLILICLLEYKVFELYCYMAGIFAGLCGSLLWSFPR